MIHSSAEAERVRSKVQVFAHLAHRARVAMDVRGRTYMQMSSKSMLFIQVEQNLNAWLRRSKKRQISGWDTARAHDTEPSHQCAKRRARHKARSKWCGTQNVAREDALIRTRPMNGSTSYRIRVCAASRTHDARVGKKHQAARGHTPSAAGHIRSTRSF